MRLLVTRPAEDAGPLAEALGRRGHEVTLEPLLAIIPKADIQLDLDGVQALLFTSANGVRAFAQLSARRDLPVFAVGDASARQAGEVGFSQVSSANGDVNDLAELVERACDPKNGALLHPAATQVAGDLKGQLEAKGFAVRRTVIYESQESDRLSAETIRLIQGDGIDGILFFSPRTARTFAKLAVQAGTVERLARVLAFALSQAVAEPLADLGFRAIRVAQKPDQESLLTRIDEEPMTGDQEPTQTAEPIASSVSDELPQPVRSAGRSLKAFLLGGVLGIALVAGAGAALWPMLVNALKSEIAQDDEGKSSAVGENDALTALSARNEGLSRRLAELEAKLAMPSPGASSQGGLTIEESERLNARFSKFEQELQALSQKRDAGSSLLVAAILLREAHIQGRPIAKEVEMLSKLSDNDAVMAPHLAALKPFVESGFSSQENLERRFASLKHDLLRSTMDANEDLWASVLRRLSVLISIRRVDEKAMESPGLDGIVARADSAVARHNLAEAVTALEGLAGPAADLAKGWLGETGAYLEAGTHVDAVLDRALTLSVKS